MSAGKNPIINIFVLLTAVALAMFFLEITAIIYAGISKERLPPVPAVSYCYHTKDTVFKFDRRVGWALKANYNRNGIYVNSLGFRSSIEYSPEKFKDKKSVILLGDSMVFGLDVAQEKIFSEILNEENTGTIFINAGVPAYSPWQELLSLEDILRWHAPDIVVIFFFQPNDLLQNHRRDCFHPGVIMKNGKLIHKPSDNCFRTEFYKRTAIYRLLDKKLLRGRDILYFANKLECYLIGKKSTMWKIQAKIYENLNGLAMQYHFRVVVVDVPAYNELLRREHYLKDDRHLILAGLCKEQGFEYFNLLHYYPKNAEGLFLDRDVHWNESGHRFIADFLNTGVLKQNN